MTPHGAELLEGVEAQHDARPRWLLLWVPGLLVALGAAVATAHGLYEVAVAAKVPAGIAWLYPLITDGLAVVAYIATARLRGSSASYAWTVVVVAAGLSGLAQAAYLAGGATVDVAPALRFGIGAWPAIAAAVAAHLLHLLAAAPVPTDSDERPTSPAVQPTPASGTPSDVQPGVQTEPFIRPDVRPDTGRAGVQPPATGGSPPTPRSLPSPQRDRAEAAAERHARRHGHWPTVSELEVDAEVSRGTAAAALRALRERPAPLHLVTENEQRPEPADPEREQDTQP